MNFTKNRTDPSKTANQHNLENAFHYLDEVF